MLDRTGSPLAVVNALALTIATLLAGAWDASGHGHQTTSASAFHCAVDHESEGAAPTSRATVGGAATLHDHSCIACQLGRSTTTASGKVPGARPLDLPSAVERPEGARRPVGGEQRQRTARGPPQD